MELVTYPNEKVKKITGAGELKIRTKQTITNYDDLVKHLQTIRKTGYSFDDREDTDMVCCMAATIYDYTGSAIAAISVSIPYAKFNEEKKKYMSEKVINAVLDISHSLGYIN